MCTHHIPQTISEESEALDELTKLGVATYRELKTAGIKGKLSIGNDDWGVPGYVIIDSNDRQWDFIPEDKNYILSPDLDSHYLEEL